MVDGLNNSHCWEQEQNESPDLLQALVHFGMHLLFPLLGVVRVEACRQEGPHSSRDHKHHGSLVHANMILKNHKEESDEEKHGQQILLEDLTIDGDHRPADEADCEGDRDDDNADNLESAAGREADPNSRTPSPRGLPVLALLRGAAVAAVGRVVPRLRGRRHDLRHPLLHLDFASDGHRARDAEDTMAARENERATAGAKKA
mmetsp:Transcript_153149/g.491106  ORF Transcript_153149/g.491106 Transcript_153149/m.491106 type:complete len:203 (+) Transcript_153149:1655-2263(+)